MTKTRKLSLIAIFAAAVVLVIIIVLLARSCTKPAETSVPVVDTTIYTVSAAITGPSTNESPNTRASAGGAGYSCGAVSWSPNDTKFRGGTGVHCLNYIDGK